MTATDAPSSNSQRYAYHTQLSSLEDDEEYAAAGDIELAERRVDAEYGGGLDDADDPFKSSGGGMDVRSAISKKQ